jgi:Flp pilus assembly protein TadG
MRPLKFTRPRSGAALVEFALILPVLLYMVFGLIEYGWLILKQQQLNNAAREAVRLAVLPSATDTAINAKVTTLMTAAGMGSTGYTTLPTTWAGIASGSDVYVTVSVTYSTVALTGSANIIPKPTTIAATVHMTKEGP